MGNAVVDTKKRVDIRKNFAMVADDLNAYIKDTTDQSNLNGNRRHSMSADTITKQLKQLKEDYNRIGEWLDHWRDLI